MAEVTLARRVGTAMAVVMVLAACRITYDDHVERVEHIDGPTVELRSVSGEFTHLPRVQLEGFLGETVAAGDCVVWRWHSDSPKYSGAKRVACPPQFTASTSSN